LELTIRSHLPSEPGQGQANEQAMMRMLLDAGADVQARGKNGNGALHTAAASNRPDLAALLLAHGADVNVRNDDGMTPLHYAAAGGHTEMVELLLKRGADV